MFSRNALHPCGRRNRGTRDMSFNLPITFPDSLWGTSTDPGPQKNILCNLCRKPSAGRVSRSLVVSQGQSLFCWELAKETPGRSAHHQKPWVSDQGSWEGCSPSPAPTPTETLPGGVSYYLPWVAPLPISQATPSVQIWLWVPLNGLNLLSVPHPPPQPILILCIPSTNIRGPSSIY